MTEAQCKHRERFIQAGERYIAAEAKSGDPFLPARVRNHLASLFATGNEADSTSAPLYDATRAKDGSWINLRRA